MGKHPSSLNLVSLLDPSLSVVTKRSLLTSPFVARLLKRFWRKDLRSRNLSFVVETSPQQGTSDLASWSTSILACSTTLAPESMVWISMSYLPSQATVFQRESAVKQESESPTSNERRSSKVVPRKV